MKRFRTLAVLLCLLFSFVRGDLAFAAPAARLFLDGEPLYSDVPPTIINNRTLVPLRVIMESLGADVVWQSNSEPILVKKHNTLVQVQVGKTQASVNDTAITLDVAPRIIHDRVMVPLRFIGESLGAGIWWDQVSRSVYITSPVGQLRPAELVYEQGTVTGLSFHSTRAMEADTLAISEDGRDISVIVHRTTAEPEYRQVTDSKLTEYTVEPIDKESARIRLTLGKDASFLLPKAELSADKLSLLISWPLAIKQVVFEQTGGVEQLTFPLPEDVKPVITDTTVEVETSGSLPGRIIVTDGANVRANPSTESARIGLIPYNGSVEVVGMTTGWYEVRLDKDTYGWIADWLVAVETEVETKVGVNVRKTPSTADKSNILTTLYPGHKIRVLERLDGWCRVEYGSGKEGYIADYLVPLESRLINAVTVPGLKISFPGVIKSEQAEVEIKDSSHLEEVSWQESGDGVTLALRLKQETSYRLSCEAEGWRLTFGTWVQQVEFLSTERGPRVRFRLDGPSQPMVKYSKVEEAVLITVPGATLTKGVVQDLPGDGTFITGVKAEQVGAEVRLTVSLPRLLAYNLQKTADSTWELVVASPTLVNKVIALDPGHGAVDPGATGTLGWHEADYTHDIAYRLRDLLTHAGSTVVMTRLYESPPIQGPARAEKINQSGADLFMSIHINSATNKAARGIETWYYPRGDNERFARLVQNSLLAELGPEWPNRGIKASYRYIICRDTLTTGLMAEIGFISNTLDESLLYQPEIRQRIAKALFNAAEEYFAK